MGGGGGVALLLNHGVTGIWGRTQEEDECISCNTDTVAIEPLFEGWSIGLTVTHTLLPCRGHIVKPPSWFFMPQIRREVKKHHRLCHQSQGREYICYSHCYFHWNVWTQFSENKSGSFLQWRYHVTGPCSKRRKGATSCTAEANNRRTRQGWKVVWIKERDIHQ